VPALDELVVAGAVQTPAKQVPMLHTVPSGFSKVEQPLTASQVPPMLHSSTLQVSAVPPEHTPVWQVSPVLQGLSLQLVPSACTVLAEQAPVVPLQVPGVLQESPGQTLGVPAHAPLLQTSLSVQKLPSSHFVLSANVPVFVHVPLVQVADSHGLPSLHAIPLATFVVVHCPCVSHV
jgi:hypothetical protein